MAGFAGTAVLATTLMVVFYRSSPYWMMDFTAYREAGKLRLTGGAVYDMVLPPFNLAFVYSPFTAWVFTVLNMVGARTTQISWLFVSILCLQAVLWRSLGTAGLRRLAPRLGLTTVGAVAMLWFGPVHWTLHVGNVNLILLALVWLDLTSPDRSRWKGLGLGIAASFKLVPGIFMLYLLLTRRFRAFGTSVAALFATVAVGALLSPKESLEYWSGQVVNLDRFETNTADHLNGHELRRTLERVMHSPDVDAVWLAAAAAVLAAGLTTAVLAARSGDDALGILITAGTGLLVSPVSWEHHWVWVAPLLALVAGRAWTRRLACAWAALAVLVGAFALRPWKWAIPQDAPFDLHRAQLLASSWLALVTLILLGLAAMRVWRARRSAGGPRSSRWES